MQALHDVLDVPEAASLLQDAAPTLDTIMEVSEPAETQQAATAPMLDEEDSATEPDTEEEQGTGGAGEDRARVGVSARRADTTLSWEAPLRAHSQAAHEAAASFAWLLESTAAGRQAVNEMIRRVRLKGARVDAMENDIKAREKEVCHSLCHCGGRRQCGGSARVTSRALFPIVVFCASRQPELWKKRQPPGQKIQGCSSRTRYRSMLVC